MVFVCLKVQPKHLIEITGGKKAGCDWGLFTTIFLCSVQLLLPEQLPCFDFTPITRPGSQLKISGK